MRLRAERYVAGVAAGDHAARVVEKQQDRAVAVVAQAREDAGHFILETKPQHQHAERGSAGIFDAVRVQQRRRGVATEIARRERFDERARLQSARDERVGRALARPCLVAAREHAAVGREHDDVVVHGVLGAVFVQALTQRRARAIALPIGGGGKAAHLEIGGQKADVRGALEQVAHQHVDRVLRLAGEFQMQLAQVLRHQAVDQTRTQRVEAVPRLHQRRQNRLHFARTGDRRRRFDRLPQQVQIAQLAF